MAKKQVLELLTHNGIKGHEPKSACDYIWDKTNERGVGRFGVQSLKSGAKTYVFKYFKGGKPAFIQIGTFGKMSLAAAREVAKTYSTMLKQKLDPKLEIKNKKELEEEEKKSRELEEQKEKMKGSFEDLINEYGEYYKNKNINSFVRFIKAIEADVYPYINKEKKAKDVTTEDVKELLAVMIKRGASTQSDKVRSYLHAAFNYGIRFENDPKSLIKEKKFGIVFNPVSPIPKQHKSDTACTRWLKEIELNKLFNLEEEDISEIYFILTMLCLYLGGQRPIEILSTEWSSIDFYEKTFLITEEVSKSGKANLIPITSTAMQIILELKNASRGNVYIFQKENRLGHVDPNSFSRNIRDLCNSGKIDKFTPRDLRRTTKTLMRKNGEFKEIADRVQGHVINDVSSKHYDLYDYFKEKKELLERWEVFLNEVRGLD